MILEYQDYTTKMDESKEGAVKNKNLLYEDFLLIEKKFDRRNSYCIVSIVFIFNS